MQALELSQGPNVTQARSAFPSSASKSAAMSGIDIRQKQSTAVAPSLVAKAL
jgi:hypothetical protein